MGFLVAYAKPQQIPPERNGDSYRSSGPSGNLFSVENQPCQQAWFQKEVNGHD